MHFYSAFKCVLPCVFIDSGPHKYHLLPKCKPSTIVTESKDSKDVNSILREKYDFKKLKKKNFCKIDKNSYILEA